MKNNNNTRVTCIVSRSVYVSRVLYKYLSHVKTGTMRVTGIRRLLISQNPTFDCFTVEDVSPV